MVKQKHDPFDEVNSSQILPHQKKHLDLSKLKRFIMDECDKLLSQLDMRRDIQTIFKMTPHEKQVMMFSATLSKEIRPVCRKFTQHPVEIYVDDESKLTLHGLQHRVPPADTGASIRR